MIHIEEKEVLPPGSWPSFEGENILWELSVSFDSMLCHDRHCGKLWFVLRLLILKE